MAERGALTPALDARSRRRNRRFSRQSGAMRRRMGGGAARHRRAKISTIMRTTGDALDQKKVADLAARTEAALSRLAPLLASQPVRRCHGDLHLRNIALIDGKPVLFDGIEFNDAFICNRSALRYRLFADGSRPSRSRRARQPRVQPLSRPHRRRRGPGALAALSLDPRRRARACLDRGSHAARKRRREARSRDGRGTLSRRGARIPRTGAAAPYRRRRLQRHRQIHGRTTRWPRISRPGPARASCAAT